jgi:SH3-like domain-containing protein
VSGKAAIVASHRASYPEPIRVRAGDELRLGAEDDEYPGWIWVVGGDDREGWMPKALLAIEGGVAVARTDYDAREMDVWPGQMVTVHEEVLGWARVEDGSGNVGWIPSGCLERL